MITIESSPDKVEVEKRWRKDYGYGPTGSAFERSNKKLTNNPGSHPGGNLRVNLEAVSDSSSQWWADSSEAEDSLGLFTSGVYFEDRVPNTGLHRTPGTYRLVATYRVDRNSPGVDEESRRPIIGKEGQGGDRPRKIWMGEVKSQPLDVEVTYEKPKEARNKVAQ